MINNDLLRRISTIFELTDETIITTFALSQCEISADQLTNFFKEKDDSAYQAIEDVQFSGFLNGLITAQRGPSDGPVRDNEQELTNNMIFNKVKIALSLKAEDVIAILELAELSLDKYELSALFRNVNNKHYKNCSDEVLSAFLKGLKIKAQ
jgi:uncharacterized protein YehS (DUF1456 family)